MGKYTGVLHDPKVELKRKFLKRGDKKTMVREVKRFLNWYFPEAKFNTDSNEYGKKTEQYVKKFENAVGLTPDGKWGHSNYVKAKSCAKADTVKSETSKTISTTTPKKENERVEDFLKFLESEHKFVKAHGNRFHRKGDIQKTWTATKKRVNAGHNVGISCVYPAIIWYLREELGISNALHGDNGSFKKTFNSKCKKYLNRYTSGHGVGMTLKQAVDKKMLQPGDIITFKSATHTATYLGYDQGYRVIDGGSQTEKLGYSKVGLKVDYSKGYYRNKKISEVLRWK